MRGLGQAFHRVSAMHRVKVVVKSCTVYVG